MARLWPDRMRTGGAAGAAVHLPARAGHHLSQWRAAGPVRFFHRGGHGSPVPPPQAARPGAGMGAFGPATAAAGAAGVCGDEHRLVAYADGYLHRATADGAGFRPGLRSRPDRAGLADAPAAVAGRMV